MHIKNITSKLYPLQNFHYVILIELLTTWLIRYVFPGARRIEFDLKHVNESPVLSLYEHVSYWSKLKS